jgi:hypothetical protein
MARCNEMDGPGWALFFVHDNAGTGLPKALGKTRAADPELSNPETRGRPLEPKASSQRGTDPLAIVTAEKTARGMVSQTTARPHDLP